MSDATPGELFDQLADDYESLRLEVGWDPWPHLWAATEGLELRGLRVLDVGCGTGEVARALIERGASVIGVDASGRMCELAASRTPGATFIEAMLSGAPRSLPLRDDAFDLVLALGCMEYVEDQEGACAELCRVARPGGRVLYALELCGEDLPAGSARSVAMFDDWRRHRRTLLEVEAIATALLAEATVEVISAYLLEETGEQLMYGRVIGQALG